MAQRKAPNGAAAKSNGHTNGHASNGSANGKALSKARVYLFLGGKPPKSYEADLVYGSLTYNNRTTSRWSPQCRQTISTTSMRCVVSIHILAEPSLF